MKAAKKFIGDMVNEIFKDEITTMEKKNSQKAMHKLYEAIMDLEEDNPGIFLSFESRGLMN